MIDAIVLAAGESSRMGKPKPLLRFEDTTFLEQIVTVLGRSDVDGITVVLGAKAAEIMETTDLSSAQVVINPDYIEGQLSSLIAGLNNTPPTAEAILLVLVDGPFISVDVVNPLVATFRKTNAPIVIPTFRGRRGHPSLFGRSVFEQLKNAPPEQGARYVVHSNEDKIVEVEVPQRSVLVGIDTPDDYRNHFGTDP